MILRKLLLSRKAKHSEVNNFRNLQLRKAKSLEIKKSKAERLKEFTWRKSYRLLKAREQ